MATCRRRVADVDHTCNVEITTTLGRLKYAQSTLLKMTRFKFAECTVREGKKAGNDSVVKESIAPRRKKTRQVWTVDHQAGNLGYRERM